MSLRILTLARPAMASAVTLHRVRLPRSLLVSSTAPTVSPAATVISSHLYRGFHSNLLQQQRQQGAESCDNDSRKEVADNALVWKGDVIVSKLQSMLQELNSDQYLLVNVKNANEESAEGNIDRCMEIPAGVLLNIIEQLSDENERVRLGKFTGAQAQSSETVLNVTVYGDNSELAIKLKEAMQSGDAALMNSKHFPHHGEHEEWIGKEYHTDDQRFNESGPDSPSMIGNHRNKK